MLGVYLSTLVLVASSTTGNARAIVRQLQSRYQTAKTLKADFFEAYIQAGGSRIAESGTVYFSRPGRMRWEYESPAKKLFLVDGTNAWFYVPADHTASRAKIKESSDWRTPIALLAGKADLGELCRDVSLVDPAKAANEEEKALAPENSVLRCDPRGDPAQTGLNEVLLEVTPQSDLARVLIRESAGVETEFRFGNWQRNIPIPEGQFHFDAPPGVSIVDQNSLLNQIR
jgi:outer membrane lipoprotein carrier protein